jgi:hypothetical protein
MFVESINTDIGNQIILTYIWTQRSVLVILNHRYYKSYKQGILNTDKVPEDCNRSTGRKPPTYWN